MERLNSTENQLLSLKDRASKCKDLIENLLIDIEKLEMSNNIKKQENNDKTKLLLTWEETEKILGIGYTSLKYNLEQGKIKRVHLSENRKPFKYEDVIEFVNNLDYVEE